MDPDTPEWLTYLDRLGFTALDVTPNPVRVLKKSTRRWGGAMCLSPSGTSGSVYPAADFVRSVGRHARRVELNLEPSAGAPLFTERHYGLATEIVPKFVDDLLKGAG